jgi:hypothetical protein
MGITSLIGKLFGADVAPPTDATKLDGTTEAALARSLSALPPDERGWIMFAEARILFSTKGDQYAFGETDDDASPSPTIMLRRKPVLGFGAQQVLLHYSLAAPPPMSALPPKADILT